MNKDGKNFINYHREIYTKDEIDLLENLWEVPHPQSLQYAIDFYADETNINNMFYAYQASSGYADNYFQKILLMTESPLERIFAEYLIRFYKNFLSSRIHACSTILPALFPQYQPEGCLFRYDFFIGTSGIGTLIEIDGREYHSKAEEFQNDRDKGNWAALNDFRLIRFTYDDCINNNKLSETIKQLFFTKEENENEFNNEAWDLFPC